MNGYEVVSMVMCVVVVAGALGMAGYATWQIDKWKGIAALAGLILWLAVMIVLAHMGDAVRQGRA